jgi:hypothetical protein
MAQAVGHRPLTTEAPVHAQDSPCGICGGQNSIGIGFSKSFDFPVNIILPWLSILIHHLEDEQQVCLRPRFRDIISPHRHEQHEEEEIRKFDKNSKFLDQLGKYVIMSAFQVRSCMMLVGSHGANYTVLFYITDTLW